MASNLFINHALTGMNILYKILGIRLTNFVINKSAGEIFTSGTTLESLINDIKSLEKRNIGGIANYVVEGMEGMDEGKIE